MKCPICDKEITDHTTDYMEHIMCEENAKCEDKNHFYHYQYAYGNSEECIGNVVFYSHHTDSVEKRKLQNAQYKAVLELEKEHYKKKVNA